MKFIECKAQWFTRPLKTRTSMSGFEGPAAKTELDDGFGVPTMKGMLTPSYACWFEETGVEDNSPTYDGTINIPDTRANRYKIAMHVRSKDLRVKDRNLETQILGEHPFVSREKAPRQYSLIAEMPEDFDGSKVVLKSGTYANVDKDPIIDPHAQVSDGEFTEVKTSTEPTAPVESDSPTKLVAPAVAVSVAAAKVGGLVPQATSAPKGFDPKAMQERANAAKAAAAAVKPEAEGASENKTQE